MSSEQKTIVITGAYGFIGSCLVATLNERGYTNLILVDDVPIGDTRQKNIEGKQFLNHVSLFEFPQWLQQNAETVNFVFHIGANSSTVENRKEIFDQYNLEYSKQIFRVCTEKQIPLVYTSSAATYGDGSLGYSDSHECIPQLKPLNLYGASKADFDSWVLNQVKKPPLWVGLKPFNVYGPNEYHKGRMASTVFHFFNQIQKNGEVNLFKSHKPAYADGGQRRDFIYVKDLVSLYMHFLTENAVSGIYNAGTGKARSFHDLVKIVFAVLGSQEKINFIDIPLDIRDRYQYYTEADMTKMYTIAKYPAPLMSLEEGIKDYITLHLLPGTYY